MGPSWGSWSDSAFTCKINGFFTTCPSIDRAFCCDQYCCDMNEYSRKKSGFHTGYIFALVAAGMIFFIVCGCCCYLAKRRAEEWNLNDEEQIIAVPNAPSPQVHPPPVFMHSSPSPNAPPPPYVAPAPLPNVAAPPLYVAPPPLPNVAAAPLYVAPPLPPNVAPSPPYVDPPPYVSPPPYPTPQPSHNPHYKFDESKIKEFIV